MNKADRTELSLRTLENMSDAQVRRFVHALIATAGGQNLHFTSESLFQTLATVKALD